MSRSSLSAKKVNSSTSVPFCVYVHCLIGHFELVFVCWPAQFPNKSALIVVFLSPHYNPSVYYGVTNAHEPSTNLNTVFQ